MEFHFFALAAHGVGISGGDRIFIELARNWGRKHSIVLHLNEEGYRMCKKNKLFAEKIKYSILPIGRAKKLGFFLSYLARIFQGIMLGLTFKLSKSGNTVRIYSASDFWMDVFPCAIVKMRYGKNVRWIATWYQTAPNPFVGYYGGRYRLSAIFYFLSQLPIKPLISTLADFVFVNNEDERKRFNAMNRQGRVFVFIGAIPLTSINQFKKANKRLLPKLYDAVFQGRFHPQKGVVELVEIWKRVFDKVPNAKLAMIGDGQLMNEVKAKIKELGMQKNITLLGYVFDGAKKYKTFAQSKLVCHPAYYDSGGMASAEAMAFGLPCIGFDLSSYKSYYPKGMLTVKLGNLNAYADKVIELLKSDAYREKIGSEAKAMVEKGWSWDRRAAQAMEFIA